MTRKYPRIISSQRYLCEEIVQEKLDDEDYDVAFVELEIDEGDGKPWTAWAIVDGHHSWAAAKLAGEVPELECFEELQEEADKDGWRVFLEEHQHDSEWYDLETGRNIW